MESFLTDDFLLDTPAARTLYHTYAAKMPIIDYHCHIDPRDIYEDRRFENIGTIPVAESLLFKGAGLGTILSFMMAVTTLSLPSMIMLKKAVKPRLLAAFIAICTMGIIVVGCFFNAIQFLLV